MSFLEKLIVVPSPEDLTLFIITSFLLTLAPGPDVLATLSLGLSRGWHAAVGFGTGCGVGCLFHTLAASVGLAAALRASPAAFTAIRLAGAAYLAWLAVQAFRSSGASLSADTEAYRSPRKYFVRGLFANTVNPKVAIFFLSFLPGFVSKNSEYPAAQMAILGVVFTCIAILVFAVLGFFSGRIGEWFRRRPGAGIWMDRITGMLFLVLAAKLAVF